MEAITITNKRLKQYHIIIRSHYVFGKTSLVNEKKKLLIVQFIKLNLVFFSLPYLVIYVSFTF